MNRVQVRSSLRSESLISHALPGSPESSPKEANKLDESPRSMKTLVDENGGSVFGGHPAF